MPRLVRLPFSTVRTWPGVSNGCPFALCSKWLVNIPHHALLLFPFFIFFLPKWRIWALSCHGYPCQCTLIWFQMDAGDFIKDMERSTGDIGRGVPDEKLWQTNDRKSMESNWFEAISKLLKWDYGHLDSYNFVKIVPEVMIVGNASEWTARCNQWDLECCSKNIYDTKSVKILWYTKRLGHYIVLKIKISDISISHYIFFKK